jgi:hypothetical protein
MNSHSQDRTKSHALDRSSLMFSATFSTIMKTTTVMMMIMVVVVVMLMVIFAEFSQSFSWDYLPNCHGGSPSPITQIIYNIPPL